MKRLLLIALLLISSPTYAAKVADLNSNTVPTTSDLTYTVDVSDTTDGSSGTGKKATIAQVFKAANMTIDGTNVGVNSLSPGTRLDVVGTVRATAFSGDGSGLSNVAGAVSDAAYSASWDGDTTTPASKNAIYDKIETIATGSSGWTDGGSNIYTTTTTDTVGIGTTNAQSKLQVKGGDVKIGTGTFDNAGSLDDLYITGNLETDGTVYGQFATYTGALTALTLTATPSTTPSITMIDSDTTDGDVSTKILTNCTATGAGSENCDLTISQQISGTLTDVLTFDADSAIYTSQNVGIGTTTPISELTVAGVITTTGTTAGSIVLSEASANGSNTVTITAPSAVTSDVTCTVEDDATPFDSCITAVTASGWTDGGTNIYLSTTTDRVGIGTTTPNATTTLEIVKQSTNALLKVSSSATGSGDYLQIFSNGNIGIGTTMAGSGLTLGQSSFIQGASASATNPTYSFTASTGAGMYRSGANIIGFATSGSGRVHIADSGIGVGGSNTITNKLNISGNASIGSTYYNVTAPTNGLIVVGNVGIGTSLPVSGATLDVRGIIVPTKVTADPCTAGSPEGGIFYNDTSNYFCFCNGTDDVKISDGSTACF